MVGMHHPKHFWMFKNLILAGQKKGWEFIILVSKKDVLEELLQTSGLKYYIIGKNQPTMFKKIIELLKYTYYTYKYSKEFNPDVYISQALLHFGLISTIRRSFYFIFEDTEYVPILHKLTIPLCTNVITPKCFKKNFGRKHIYLNGLFEVSYLHPNYFSPNPEVLKKLGVGKGEKFVIMRFVSWNASHDIGQKGLTLEIKINAIKEISKYAKVFITSESTIPIELERYRINIPSEMIHGVLYYANLYYGESPTMTTESAILGTPAICISSWAYDLGNIIELKNLGLIQCFKTDDEDIALQKALDWLMNKNIKQEWQRRLNKMDVKKIDVTARMVKFLEEFFQDSEQ